MNDKNTAIYLWTRTSLDHFTEGLVILSQRLDKLNCLALKLIFGGPSVGIHFRLKDQHINVLAIELMILIILPLR